MCTFTSNTVVKFQVLRFPLKREKYHTKKFQILSARGITSTVPTKLFEKFRISSLGPAVRTLRSNAGYFHDRCFTIQ